MREPVLFQKAIDGIFAGDTVPDLVLEIGPHQTLVSPIKQVRVFFAHRTLIERSQSVSQSVN